MAYLASIAAIGKTHGRRRPIDTRETLSSLAFTCDRPNPVQGKTILMTDLDHLGIGTRLYTAFLGTAAGRWVALNIAPRVDPWLMRVTRGHIAMTLMLPSTLLTTIGAKSRIRRTCAVLYFRDRGDVIVVASSFGRDRHPAWYHNLKANPHVHIGVGDSVVAMTAAVVRDGDELARLWDPDDERYRGYVGSFVQLPLSGRTIPIIRLSAST